MLQSNQKSYAAEKMNEQQIDQLSHALYSYCKVMSVPKMGAAPAVITILRQHRTTCATVKNMI